MSCSRSSCISWLRIPYLGDVVAMGDFYYSAGEGDRRRWSDMVRHGFISAGGGRWYSRTLRALSPGDRVWAHIPKVGYVGVGVVTRARGARVRDGPARQRPGGARDGPAPRRPGALRVRGPGALARRLGARG